MLKFTLFLLFALVAFTYVSGHEKVCFEDIITGSCEANIPSYGYSTEKNECIKFTYGGCDGNGNRFSTKEECEKTCGGCAGSGVGG